MIVTEDLKDKILDFNGFPREGICFRDISPLLRDVEAFNYVIDKMSEMVLSYKPDLIVAPESRGFIFGAPIASYAGRPLVLARKKGKLPGELVGADYDKEYGTDILYIQKSAIAKGQRVVIVDDVLATGGTIKCIESIINKLGAELVGVVTLISLDNFKRDIDDKCSALIHYD